MRFPDACAGIKKVFLAEMLTIAAVACTLLILLTDLLLEKAEAVGPESRVLIDIAVPGGLALCGAVLLIAAQMIKVKNLKRAGEDAHVFRYARNLAVADFVVSTVQVFLLNGDLASDILGDISDILTLLTSSCIIGGIMQLAGKCGNADMEVRGKRLIWLMVADITFSMLWGVVCFVIANDSATLEAVPYVAELAVYLIYLAYLRSAVKLLEGAEEGNGLAEADFGSVPVGNGW